MEYFDEYRSPIGWLRISSNDTAITGIAPVSDKSAKTQGNFLTAATIHQLEEYFGGKRTVFDLPIAPQGSSFSIAVWKELQKIPYGITATYGEIAKAMDKPGCARAVGGACRRNPILLVIPCHRIVGNSDPGGFAMELHCKMLLLALENPILRKKFGKST